MDSTVEIESSVRSEGVGGEKRAAEEDVELVGPKKVKKVAEIVLVLAAMGKIRGGMREPSEAETEMMTEASEKLAEVCGGFKPKDVFPRDVFGCLIDDLGLNKLKEPRLGFRPPVMSIAEKVFLTKRKMEKSEEFSLHSAAYSSQRLHMNSGEATESRGTSHAVRMFPADKPTHVSAVNATPLPYQLPTSEVRPMVSTGLPSSHLVRDSAFALPRVEGSHFRLDGRSNGSSYISQVSANDHAMAKTPTLSVQPQSASSAKGRSDNKVPAHTSVKVGGAADVNTTWMAPPAATSKPFITQTTSGNPPRIPQQLKGTNFVQAPSSSNSHNEIGKIVQKLLHPQRPQYPTWNPPSRDYMNKALTCQMCKQTINDVDSVLVCDACEKGFHLKCLQSSNHKGVPRGEWHCGKCLTVSQGKPLPPKYGRVTRNANTPKISSNAATVQSTTEKKVVTLDEKVSQQKITANGTSNLQSAPTGTTANSSNQLVSGLKMANLREIPGNDSLLNRGKIDDKPPPATCPNNLLKTSGEPGVSPAVLSVGISCERKLVPESNTHPPAKPEIVPNMLLTPGNAQDNDQTALANGAEISLKECPNNNHMVKDSEKSCGGETLNCNSNEAIKQDDQGVAQAKPVETSGTSIEATDYGGSSSYDLHSVDWVGNILQVVDEKTYYQSCRINGVEYKIQDYALFRYNNNKMMPSKLQAMWEDSTTRSKWVVFNRCYFPGDLPEEVGCPPAPESNEVYESNHNGTVMAGLIQGRCEVLPSYKFIEESERTHLGMEANDGLRPRFLCKWFYDEPKRLFRAVSS